MLRVGVVPFLNAVPLVAPLAGRAQVVEDVPSRLGGPLERGLLDAALLPVAEALDGVGDGYLGRHGIASEGPVESVVLFLRRPLERVRSVCLDPASRTSAVLARHVVTGAAGPGVAFVEAERAGPDPRRRGEDAVLVIGDAALEAAAAWDGPRVDLGEAWTRETGLPFVYARWTARKGLEPDARRALEALLEAAAEVGLARRAYLAREWARRRGRDPARAAAYVATRIQYRIGMREEAALARFADVRRRVEASSPPEARHA